MHETRINKFIVTLWDYIVHLFAVNCLDRYVARDPSAVAIIWEKNKPGEQEEVSYKYVRLIVNTVPSVFVPLCVQ